MNILVVGGGAIGMYVAARIRKYSTTVHISVLARDTFVNAAQGGFMVTSDSSNETRISVCPVSNICDAAGQPHFDAVIFATKAYALTKAVRDVASAPQRISPETLFVCLQNGIGCEEIISSQFAANQVLAGTVTTPITLRGPAHIRIERERGIGLAPFAGIPSFPLPGTTPSELVNEMGATWFPEYRDMKWSKLLLNLVGNATSAIFDMTVRDVYHDPSGFEIENRMLQECLAVMTALEVRVVNLPGGKAKLLQLLLAFVPKRILQAVLGGIAERGRGDKRPSFYYDVANGSGWSEVGFLNGAVARAGSDCGVPTPINSALESVLTDIVTGRQPWQKWHWQTEKFLTLALSAQY